MSIRIALITAAGSLALAASSGCSTVQVHSDAAPGIDFSAYKTFTQAPPPSSAGKSMPGYSTITGDHIQASIAHDLEVKGLTRASSSRSADVIIVFSIDGQPRQEIDGADDWYGGDVYTVNYVQGTLVIDVIDAKKKKLIWHSYGQTDLYGSGGGTSSQVDNAVNEILKGFPPQAN
jgi:hypothetical protein